MPVIQIYLSDIEEAALRAFMLDRIKEWEIAYKEKLNNGLSTKDIMKLFAVSISDKEYGNKS